MRLVPRLMQLDQQAVLEMLGLPLSSTAQCPEGAHKETWL